MEIISVASSGDPSSTLVQDVNKRQNMDAFSELLAMLFSNMLIPGSNQYSLEINQSNTADINSTTKNNVEQTNMLSIIDKLRISSSQLKETQSTQKFINSNSSSLLNNLLINNTDFQKLLNLKDDVPAELQEFINNINNSNSSEAESLGTKLGNNNIELIPEQLSKNVTTTEVKTMLDLINAQTEDNSPVKELKEISEILNSIKAEKSSEETIKGPNNSLHTSSADNLKTIKSTIETSTYEKNNSASTQSEAKIMKPEEKTINYLEPVSNIKNQNVTNLIQQDKVPESTLIEKPQDIIDITVEKFKTLKLPGSTEVTVKLRPEELGEVSLKLVLEKGQINGSITADRKEVVLMLQNNLEQLKTDLKNNNVNLNNITVNIQAGEDFDSKNSRRGFSNKQNKNNRRMVSAFEDEIQSYDSLEGFNIIA